MRQCDTLGREPPSGPKTVRVRTYFRSRPRQPGTFLEEAARVLREQSAETRKLFSQDRPHEPSDNRKGA